MTYSLVITERAEQLLDDCVSYLISVLENSSAALHLLNGISQIYDRLEDNPFQFADSRDAFLRSKGYKEAFVSDMDYSIRNIASCKILEKCGYTKEGLIRQGKMVNTWCDYYVYGILDSDFV